MHHLHVGWLPQPKAADHHQRPLITNLPPKDPDRPTRSVDQLSRVVISDLGWVDQWPVVVISGLVGSISGLGSHQ